MIYPWSMIWLSGPPWNNTDTTSQYLNIISRQYIYCKILLISDVGCACAMRLHLNIFLHALLASRARLLRWFYVDGSTCTNVHMAHSTLLAHCLHIAHRKSTWSHMHLANNTLFANNTWTLGYFPAARLPIRSQADRVVLMSIGHTLKWEPNVKYVAPNTLSTVEVDQRTTVIWHRISSSHQKPTTLPPLVAN